MPDIKIRASPVQPGISWIEIAKVADAVRCSARAVRESRAEIIHSVSVGVVRSQTQSSVVQILTLEAQVEGVIPRRSSAAASIDARVLIVRSRVVEKGWIEGITQVGLPAAKLVVCGNVIKVNTVCSGVFEREDGVTRQLALQ